MAPNPCEFVLTNGHKTYQCPVNHQNWVTVAGKQYGSVHLKTNPQFRINDLVKSFSSLEISRNSKYIVVDIETQNSLASVSNFRSFLKVSVVVAYDSETDRCYSYSETELQKLFDFCVGKTIVGYNTLDFDFVVLAQYGFEIKNYQTIDLIKVIHEVFIGRRMKLTDLCQENLGRGKDGKDGLYAIELCESQKTDELIEYCTNDVMLTKDLYLLFKDTGRLTIKHNMYEFH